MRTYAEIAADARPGAAFSNSTCWEVWATGPSGCYTCRNDGMGLGRDEPSCPIFSVSLIERTTPAEWQERSPLSVQDYVCSEYDRRPDDDPGDEPAPPDPGPHPGQLDIFDVYADQVIQATSTQQLEAQR
jgi:hypothetical protein